MSDFALHISVVKGRVTKRRIYQASFMFLLPTKQGLDQAYWPLSLNKAWLNPLGGLAVWVGLWSLYRIRSKLNHWKQSETWPTNVSKSRPIPPLVHVDFSGGYTTKSSKICSLRITPVASTARFSGMLGMFGSPKISQRYIHDLHGVMTYVSCIICIAYVRCLYTCTIHCMFCIYATLFVRLRQTRQKTDNVSICSLFDLGYHAIHANFTEVVAASKSPEAAEKVSRRRDVVCCPKRPLG